MFCNIGDFIGFIMFFVNYRWAMAEVMHECTYVCAVLHTSGDSFVSYVTSCFCSISSASLVDFGHFMSCRVVFRVICRVVSKIRCIYLRPTYVNLDKQPKIFTSNLKLINRRKGTSSQNMIIGRPVRNAL